MADQDLAAWARQVRAALAEADRAELPAGVGELLDAYPEPSRWGAAMATLSLLVLAACVLVLLRPAAGPSQRRQRGMSFSSELMAQGGFPAHAQMPAHLINALVYFDTLPSREQLAAAVREHLLPYRRFSAVPEPAPGGGSWRWRDVEVDVDAHIVSSPAHHTPEDAHRAMEALIQQPLRDEAAPRWEIHLIATEAGPGSMAALRIDHCVGDGISLMQAMLGALTDAETGEPLPTPAAFSRREKRPALSAGLALRFAGSLVKALRLSMGRYDSDVPFTSGDKPHMKYGGARRVVVVPPMDLAEIKRIKQAAGDGLTVNDVLMAVTAGAIRRYCVRRGEREEALDEARVRALLPIAFPRKPGASKAEALRNQWCFLSAGLPVGERTPEARLRAAAATCRALKESPDAPAMMTLVNLTQYMPLAMTRQTSFDMFSRHSVVFSNVPGPQQPVAFAGQRIVGVQMVFPNLLTQVGILSLEGRVFMNWVVDPEVVKSPEWLAECMVEELAALGGSF